MAEPYTPGSKDWWIVRRVANGDVRRPWYELNDEDIAALVDARPLRPHLARATVEMIETLRALAARATKAADEADFTDVPPAPSPPDGWRGIESAPKDGTRVLAWIVHQGDDFCPDPFALPSLMYWEEADGAAPYAMAAGWRKEWVGEPTHWQPLPAPPLPSPPLVPDEGDERKQARERAEGEAEPPHDV